MNPAASATLDRVVRGQLCAGCGLCAGVSDGAIRMRMAEPGFARPEQVRAIAPALERIIAEACPGSTVSPWEGEVVHPYWGPLNGVFVGHAVDPATRFKASSGGALTALLVHALRQGLVDRVIQVTADPAQPTGNIVVCARTEAEVLASAGSRYAPSSPLEAIEAVLTEGGRAAFVGKPCDVSALRALARHDPRVAEHIPLILSFFCAGVPSKRGADKVLEAMGVGPADEVDTFRYRGEGWPGRATVRLKTGEERSMSYDESWGGFLSDHVQFRCKICPDGVGGVADVACADAWYGDAGGYPDFDERDGRSLVVARTAAGAALVASAAASRALEIEPLDPEEINRMQPGQTQRKRNVLPRTAALAFTLQPRPRMHGLWIISAARNARISESFRNFLGTIRRIVSRRR